MGEGLSHWRTSAATVFAMALIGGAYILARSVTHPPSAEASTETAILQAIATKDSDSDGLPDWEEALYGTDSHNPDTRNLGMTDGRAVATGLIVPKAIADIPAASFSGTMVDSSLPPAPADDTLTAAFAKNLFTIYINTVKKTGGNLSEQDMSDVAQQALADLSDSIARARDLKSAGDITVTRGAPEARKAYAAAAEAVLNANTSNANKSELLYLQDAVRDGDMTALPHIVSIAKAYRATAAGLAVLPVPPELATHDLALINALARASEISSDFARVADDPLATMLALQQYPTAVLALADAFIALANDYRVAGVTLAPGVPGAAFVSVIYDVAADQKSAQKP